MREAGGLEVEEEERESMAGGSTIKGEDFTSLGRSLSLVMTVEGSPATQGSSFLALIYSKTFNIFQKYYFWWLQYHLDSNWLFGLTHCVLEDNFAMCLRCFIDVDINIGKLRL